MKRAILTKIVGRVYGLFVDLLIGTVSNKLEKQEHLIDRGDWDNLIVLDACRYDYLEEEYGNFLSGTLKCVCSPASDTYSWLSINFNKWRNITVYSAHPVLNSFGVERGGYRALPNFKRIVDVWRWGWDEGLSTVPPNEVDKAVIDDIKKGVFRGRNIIWYMQPHAPYIGETKLDGPERPPMWGGKRLTIEISRMVRNKTISKEELREAYRDNLRLVLQSVAELVPYLSGKTVITSDHGELLAEMGLYGHGRYRRAKMLREVPWLAIEKQKVLYSSLALRGVSQQALPL